MIARPRGFVKALFGWSDHEHLVLATSNAAVLRNTIRDGGGLVTQ
jgi:hypothetical protein